MSSCKNYSFQCKRYSRGFYISKSGQKNKNKEIIENYSTNNYSTIQATISSNLNKSTLAEDESKRELAKNKIFRDEIIGSKSTKNIEESDLSKSVNQHLLVSRFKYSVNSNTLKVLNRNIFGNYNLSKADFGSEPIFSPKMILAILVILVIGAWLIFNSTLPAATAVLYVVALGAFLLLLGLLSSLVNELPSFI